MAADDSSARGGVGMIREEREAADGDEERLDDDAAETPLNVGFERELMSRICTSASGGLIKQPAQCRGPFSLCLPPMWKPIPLIFHECPSCHVLYDS